MKTIISTQMPAQFKRLQNLIGDKCNLLNIPMIRVEQVEITEELKNKINAADTYDWIIFTSMKAIEFFFKIYDKKITDLSAVKFACIGSSTEKKLAEYNIKTDYVNEGNTSIEFHKHLIYKNIIRQTDKVMHPTSNKAGKHLQNNLSNVCEFETVVIYNTLGIKNIADKHKEYLKNENYELILFTSPSAFTNFVDITKNIIKLDNNKIAAIGDITKKAIQDAGFEAKFVASKPQLENLAWEICRELRIES